MRLVAWCIMPTHWHMIVWPGQGGNLARFFGGLTLTHTERWYAHRHTTGQERFLTPWCGPGTVVWPRR
jgi:putative transposase